MIDRSSKSECGHEDEPAYQHSNLIMEHYEAEAWLRFMRDRRWSRQQKHALLMYFGSIDAAVCAKNEQARTVVGGRRKRAEANVDEAQVQVELDWLEHPQHHLIHRFDSRYPKLLQQISDPPIALFANGDLSLLDAPKVAIVGSRRPSPVGVKVAADIASSLSKLGVVIVSGMALGVDAVAHRAALEAGGPTIAVTGAGPDVIYPRRHKNLHQQIANQGLLLSEYPFGTQPSRHSFPDRNRLVSGISCGVVIIEAAERSGTLITARMALEQNRELMVVPGAALSEQYRGSHRLIRDGAALVCGSQEVLMQLSSELSAYCQPNSGQNQRDTSTDVSSEMTSTQKKVWQELDYDAVLIDELVTATGLSISEVTNTLLELELNSMVAATSEGGYIRTA